MIFLLKTSVLRLTFLMEYQYNQPVIVQAVNKKLPTIGSLTFFFWDMAGFGESQENNPPIPERNGTVP